MRATILGVSVALGACALQAQAEDRPSSARSYHTHALSIVLASQAEVIARVDPVDPATFDTLEREWRVQRPVGPGVIDTRPLLTVSYLVGGKVMATWEVNTKTDKATRVR